MFNFSSKTIVNKEYKLSDFLAQIKASKEIRDDAKKIDKIVFQNVINANSLNSIEDDDYKNIYVIRIYLREVTIPRLFIEELDRNIAFHTYFIFEYHDDITTMVAFKEIGQRIKISSRYYVSHRKQEETINVPLLNSVKDAYKFILAYQIGIQSRNSESPDEYITRGKAINRLQFQISKTQSGIKYETQPKKKFEYNERLRRYKNELEELMKVEE